MEITVRYYGIGTFHQIPQQAGVLAELEIDGRIIGSDSSWQARPLNVLRKWVPKVSIQMEPAEFVEANLDLINVWLPSIELFKNGEEPWKNLSPRLSEPLIKKYCQPQFLKHALKIKKASRRVCVPVTQIAHPKLIEANRNTSRPVIILSVLIVQSEQVYSFFSEDWGVLIEGLQVNGEIKLIPGQYKVLFFCKKFYGHQKEIAFPFINMVGSKWEKWEVFVKDEYCIEEDDIIWEWFNNPKVQKIHQHWFEFTEELSSNFKQSGGIDQILGKPIDISMDQLFMEDYTADFAERVPKGSVLEKIENKEGVCKGGNGFVVIHPVSGHDVELCFDFGEQHLGYFNFLIESDEGVTIDLHLVEYITDEGIIQHTAEFNRNGMRYITKKGLNNYTSLKRRSGRYLFITLRNFISPVIIEQMDIIESAAAVRSVERFNCSDNKLNNIWDICERTLKFGIEDVFTDCSLYEQTLWIGDARNEALYAYQIYGNYAVSARSLELGAQSLEQFPIVGCQVPSSWTCILPAWSFLWGIHVWEHYFYSGDLNFLTKIWPAVKSNLQGAFYYIDEKGLFSGTFWNMFDWAAIEDKNQTVFHNNMLLVGALNSAEKCAIALNNQDDLQWLKDYRIKLVDTINMWWDDSMKSYPDALYENGNPSLGISQHTSILAILYNVIVKENISSAKGNLLSPPKGMTRTGSPFASQFLYEALDLLDEHEVIMESIYTNYIPMLEAGATTAWETYPDSTCSPDGFPTRSHSHGWSCSPLYFINRIVLGIRQSAPGGKAFVISPWTSDLLKASGGMATPNGSVRVKWEIEGDQLSVNITVPDNIKIDFKPNKSHKKLRVNWNIIIGKNNN